jgi:hypothetical protein
MNRVVLGSLALVLGSCGTPTWEKASPETLESLVREYVFAEQPKTNPGTQFLIEECEVSGLWQALRAQLFWVRKVLPDGGGGSTRDCWLYSDHEATPFVVSFGGHGLMSAVVLDGDLYYSHSSGSGIHRSHLGHLALDGDSLGGDTSGGYAGVDLFVRSVDGHIAVEAGEFVGFQSWNNGIRRGWVRLDPSLGIVDGAGAELPPDFPRPVLGEKK